MLAVSVLILHVEADCGDYLHSVLKQSGWWQYEVTTTGSNVCTAVLKRAPARVYIGISRNDIDE